MTERDHDPFRVMSMDEGEWRHPTGQVPEVVDLVALGQSTRSDWISHCLSKDRQPDARYSEVWTVNRGIRAFRADLAFVLDEVASEATKDPAYGQALSAYPWPIITTVAAAPYEQCRRYPSRWILDTFGIPEGADPYWHNSIPMVLAYAGALGVPELRMWGCDYVLEDGRVLEADRANCEFWMGRCMQRGMKIGIPHGSTLCNTSTHRGSLWVYGLVAQTGVKEWLRGGAVRLAVLERKA